LGGLFLPVGCQECSLAEIDLKHMRDKYPQLVVEEFNIYDQAALGQWLAGGLIAPTCTRRPFLLAMTP